MATVDREPPETHEGPRRLYEDADKLLSLAESCQDRCENYDRCKRELVGWSLGGLFILAVIVVVMTTTAFTQGTVLSKIAFIIDFFTIVLILYYTFKFRVIYQEYAKMSNREKRALYSIVDMLREIEKGIAEESHLTTLERAEFRIRLSRFDIGPGWSEHHARP